MPEENDIVAEARKRFGHCVEWEADNRERAVEDLEFHHGDQWPDQVREEREEQNQPCLVLNKTKLFVRQIVNDIRQMRPAIKVRAVDSVADPETADVMNGLIRAIEKDSSAESAYDWAVEYAVIGGIGYWEVETDYEDENSFEQVIKINRVRNPFSVYVDPAAEQQDASDMRYCFKVHRMPKEEFEQHYPDATGPAEWTAYGGPGDDKEWWWGEDYVRLAYYWMIDEEEREISLMPDGTVLPGNVEGAVATRMGKQNVVTKRLITGNEVLEESSWAGKYIPIIRCLGREIDIEGEIYWNGLVRDIQDPARMYNYMRSSEVERIALAPKSPYVGPNGAFKNPKWRTANKKNHAFLEWDSKAVMQAGGQAPRREAMPEVSTGILQSIQNASEEFKSITGIYDAGIGARSNEVSGVAINNRRTESDVANFDFVDNLARAMTYCGKVLVDLIPKIYTEPRAIRILDPQGQDQQVMVNQPYIDPQTMQPKEFNLSAGRYDVVVDTGPSYATQRQEAFDSMLEVMRAFPDSVPILADILARNADWPDADEVVKRMQTLMPPELLTGDNPQFAAALQQKDQQIQMGQAQIQQLQQIMQQMQVALQNKQGELGIKEGELANKIQKTINDHVEGMTKLEIDATRDLGPAGAAY